MLSYLLYYIILKPLSKLPLSILYQFSNFLYLIIFKIFSYRKKVVIQNLSNSFPNKNTDYINDITKKFYSHLCDLIVESIKLSSMSEEEAVKRCQCINPELLENYYKEGKSIILCCGHYNNWELTGVSFAAQVPHKILCIYTPLSNRFMNQKLKSSREKYGACLIPKNDIKEAIANSDEPCIVVFGTDQNPSPKSKKLYWTEFLNQDTAVNFGAEKYAKDYDFPVLMMKINKVKRGYYNFEFEVVSEQPRATSHGEITNKHTQILENQIKHQAEFWLWSHKRWKRKRVNPQNI